MTDSSLPLKKYAVLSCFQSLLSVSFHQWINGIITVISSPMVRPTHSGSTNIQLNSVPLPFDLHRFINVEGLIFKTSILYLNFLKRVVAINPGSLIAALSRSNNLSPGVSLWCTVSTRRKIVLRLKMKPKKSRKIDHLANVWISKACTNDRSRPNHIDKNEHPTPPKEYRTQDHITGKLMQALFPFIFGALSSNLYGLL